jgi:hypothetical protein
MITAADSTSGAGIVNPSDGPDFTPIISGVRVAQCFFGMFCGPLFFLFYFGHSMVCPSAFPFPYQDCYHPQRPISARGLIAVLKWKKACINIFITYFNIELKRTKLTSHTDTKLIWI